MLPDGLKFQLRKNSNDFKQSFSETTAAAFSLNLLNSIDRQEMVRSKLQCHGHLQPIAQPSVSAKIYPIFIHSIKDFLIVCITVIIKFLEKAKFQSSYLSKERM